MKIETTFLIGITIGIILSFFSLPYLHLSFRIDFPYDVMVLTIGLALIIISFYYYKKEVGSVATRRKGR